ncbi:MAG: hypothetical protein IJ460_06085 [Clostridia bacterium]|nr:hypothetical protein [Clostridia bacterium]
MKSKILRYYCSKAISPDDFEQYTPSTDLPTGKEGPLTIAEHHDNWLWIKEWQGDKIKEYPVYLNDELRLRIESYFDLTTQRPELFLPSKQYPIVLDRKAMLDFEESTGKHIGIVFDNSPFYYAVSDLIAPEGKKNFAYARIIYCNPDKNGTVIIPYFTNGNEEPLIGILNVFRHSIRKNSGGEFPRGFMAPGISPEQNAAKELSEEFHIAGEQLKELVYLGKTRADTGLSAGEVNIYLAKITGVKPCGNTGHEGIVRTEWLTENEFFRRIHNGIICDGYTQSAGCMYQLWRSSAVK